MALPKKPATRAATTRSIRHPSHGPCRSPAPTKTHQGGCGTSQPPRINVERWCVGLDPGHPLAVGRDHIQAIRDHRVDALAAADRVLLREELLAEGGVDEV